MAAERRERGSGRRPPPRPPRRPEPRRRRRRSRHSESLARIAVAIPAAVVVVAFAAAGGLVWALFMFALGAICLHELFELHAGAQPARLAGLLSLAGLVLAAHYGDQFQILLVAVATIPILFALTVAGPGVESPTISMAITLFGVWWIGLAFAHAVLLRDLPHGDGVLIDVLVATFIGDAGAYFGGRLFGTRPLAPGISPSKTVEGLVIGVLFGVGAAWLAGLYQDWLTGGQAVLIGLGAALAAPLGDLFESLVKRDAGAKDTGRLFGPHGGALDRLDAALFSVVVGYYVWSALL